jgi:hypothetical protein
MLNQMVAAPAGKPTRASVSKTDLLNEFLKGIVAREYKITVNGLVNVQHKHINAEARGMCFYALRQYTPLSYKQIAELYGISNKGAVHRQVTDMIDWLQVNVLEVVRKYSNVKRQLDEFSRKLDEESEEIPRAQLVGAETPQGAPAPQSQEKEFLNFTGDEEYEANAIEAPSLDDSPLSDPVINRNNLDGILHVLNGSSVVEDAKIVSETRHKSPDPAPAPAPADDEQDDAPGLIEAEQDDEQEDAPSMLDEEDFDQDDDQEPDEESQQEPEPEPVGPPPRDNVGEMKFETSDAGTAGQPGYSMPPEMAEKIKSFTTNSALGMAELFIPNITAKFVEIDEVEALKIMEDASERAKDSTAAKIHKINKDNKESLRNEVKSVIPFIREPLEMMVGKSNLKMSPVAAVAMFALYLIGMVYLSITKMQKQREMFMTDLQIIMAQDRAAKGHKA